MSTLHSVVDWEPGVTCETWLRPASLFLLPATWARYSLSMEDVLEVVKKFELPHLVQLACFYLHDSFDVEHAKAVPKRSLVDLLLRVCPYTPSPTSQLCSTRPDHVPNLPILAVTKRELHALVEMTPLLLPTYRNKVVYPSAWAFKDARFVPVEWDAAASTLLMHRVIPTDISDPATYAPINAPIHVDVAGVKHVVVEEAVFLQRAAGKRKKE